MSRLASSWSELEPRYDAVVVGSGYGGAIAASRLARAGQKVCLLERGREFQPGEYPDTLAEGSREVQVDSEMGHVGSRIGLYDLRVNPEMSAFVGCGLGGTSLVNANVALRADPRVLDDARWPRAFRDDWSLLESGYGLAEAMLRPTPYPPDRMVGKLAALARSALALGRPFYRPPINVNFAEGINHVGVAQHPCVDCGDCVSGCNYAAKNTVLMNYLPDAANFGAHIFTQVGVRYLERTDSGWNVYYQLLESGREGFASGALPFVTASIVVLAAGTLGSTEILLRSKARGLPCSDRLGSNFSGNGDVLGFAYNTDGRIDPVGWGQQRLAPVGPCITGIIDCRNEGDLQQGFVIEEGSVPSPLAELLPAALLAAAKAVGKDTDQGVADFLAETRRELESLAYGPRRGAIANTQVFLVMAHDEGGRLTLESDRLRIRWPNVGAQPIFARIAAALERATVPLGGTYVPNPMSASIFGNDLVTVHPLGGCPMGEDASTGVVNHKSQAFSSNAGSACYADLYVCDGAVVPRSLGVNPLLTISALAERTLAMMAHDRGWTLTYQLPSSPTRVRPSARIGIEFTERMQGHLMTAGPSSFGDPARALPGADSMCEFTLTIISDDLEALLTQSDHRAILLGTVTAPALAPEPLAARGEFNLFVNDPTHIATRLMRYRMGLTTPDGRTFFFEGTKYVHDDPGPDVWKDTTTLLVTIYQGSDATGPVVARGTLTIALADFAHQLTTLRVTNASSTAARLEATTRFGRYFAGVLYRTYGSLIAGPTFPGIDLAPRKKRPLRVGPPETTFFTANDGVVLRLTRFVGGARGPVVLAHGLGVSSSIFTTDTIDTNLLEYLVAQGFDVWLLDYRASIELPASEGRFSADDVAMKDFPAAIAKVRELSAKDRVHVVAHCFGSTTFLMAMLGGLEHVASAVCSQATLHVVVPPLAHFKSGLHLPTVLEALGLDALSAYARSNAGWLEQLYDRGLGALPMPVGESCESAVCHRISFMYAPLYRHDRLNPATHDALGEMFGIANLDAFDQMARMVQAGRLVDREGRDVYLPEIKRLAIPITFLHGADNACFLPRGSELSFELLRSSNPDVAYARHVIPDYGHIDCIFGKNAAADVYPHVLAHFERLGV